MFAVVVTFNIKDGCMHDFLPLMAANAAASLSQEPDCLQFDVCTDPDRPDEVFLYETYNDQDAFQAHLASPHFREFDAAVSNMIAAKTVKTFRMVLS